MSLEIGQSTFATRVLPAYPVRPVVPAERADGGSGGFDVVFGSVPPAPTDEARRQVDRAAEIVDQLHDANRELHFHKDEETGRVVIEVRDLDGKVLKTIPPSHALDVMSGGAL